MSHPRDPPLNHKAARIFGCAETQGTRFKFRVKFQLKIRFKNNIAYNIGKYLLYFDLKSIFHRINVYVGILINIFNNNFLYQYWILLRII